KELEEKLPAAMRRALARKEAQLYTIDAIAIARDLGLGGRINTVLQAAFFKLTSIIDLDLAVRSMKQAAHDTYFLKRGKEVVDMNIAAIDRGLDGMMRVVIPDSWRDAVSETATDDLPDFIKDIVEPINRQNGDTLPVSLFKRYNVLDGTWPAGTTKYEKRGTAVEVPQWESTKCIQCNRCAFVCPHAAIRPVLLNSSEIAAAPSGFTMIKAVGKEFAAYAYRVQVSPSDCTGCGSCVAVCPAKEKALTLQPLDTQVGEASNWTYAVETVTVKRDAASEASVKSSQFLKPYFEFSGACAGCGETPYIKLATQLFGDRMYIANASGCSSAYGGSTPSTPYCTDARGHGPAWAMSLFEDNAEYAYGFLLGQDAVRKQLVEAVSSLANAGVAKAACEGYLSHKDSAVSTSALAESLVAALRDASPNCQADRDAVEFVLENAEFLTKKSVWAFGGDGWAYDIGYGGLDHVLASGRDINMLVLDTEVYSNTGGQSSKATAAGAVAKFAAGGKTVKKKDLGMMAISYGYIYVAQVAMGYDQAQTLRALREAEAYPGPSLIIAYSPCIEHGIKVGMGRSQDEMKRAVEAGYWHLYRFNPLLKAEGKNPFILDSPAPTGDLKAFLRGEGRYATLELSFPERAGELFDKAARDADERLQSYQVLANGGTGGIA
ncbi:MAG: thiamine pyrophosphate-dependent enzyme, partial [Planctomycetaceae bacterium]|nr:thiamine pyrophosphate-dependent enzyme [Planctomycetaceae bacterium]